MKTAVLYQLKEPLVVEDVTVPEPGYGQVLVRMAYSSLCHTQLLEIQGKRAHDPYLPHTLGHEGAGVVEAVGPGVTRVRPGDHVVISWIKGQGINARAPVYKKGEQVINAGAAATFVETGLISENRLTVISKKMPLDKAVLLGCAVPTGAGAVIHAARVTPGSSVAIFGAGGVGLCAIQAAALVNASKVIAVDIYDHKLRLAKAFGATHVVNSQETSPVEAIREISGTLGADYAIEVVGLPQTMEQAFECLRPDGGLAVLVGNLPHGGTITIDPFALICGKRLIGTWGGETDPQRDIPRYVALYREGKLKLDELISHRFSLEEINTGFDALERGEVTRAVVDFGQWTP